MAAVPPDWLALRCHLPRVRGGCGAIAQELEGASALMTSGPEECAVGLNAFHQGGGRNRVPAGREHSFRVIRRHTAGGGSGAFQSVPTVPPDLEFGVPPLGRFDLFAVVIGEQGAHQPQQSVQGGRAPPSGEHLATEAFDIACRSPHTFFPRAMMRS